MAKKKVTEEESSKLELNAQINSELGRVIDDFSKKQRKDVMLCVNHFQS